MWSVIQLFAAILMFFVCRSQQVALDEYKAREIDGEAAIEMSDKNTDKPYAEWDIIMNGDSDFLHFIFKSVNYLELLFWDFLFFGPLLGHS